MADKEKPEVDYVYRPWITVNGKRVYPKNAKVFRFPRRGRKRRDH